VNPAYSTKPVLDDMAVESVSSQVFFRSPQLQILPRNEPKQRALPRADGTIASHRIFYFTLGLKGDFPAMTAALVFHGASNFFGFATALFDDQGLFV
jgi:hypothetical protein